MIVFKKIIISIVSLIALFSSTALFAGPSADNLLLIIPPILSASKKPVIPLTRVELSAFNDFSCTSNWMNRDGALGLAPYSGDGSCEAVFPGVSATYNIVLTIQTEFDGSSPYRVSINNEVIKSGVYPRSSSLGCDCPLDNWRTVCPNKNVNIKLGTFTVKKGDKIKFWGEDDYPCRPAPGMDPHGSYAEWHGMSFAPVQ